ncbi:hypothetical protein IQ250_26960 [Pseudanabaenaceae cyanobacterium LEGE 13415]|nr:hypothetical protein [Pseudanabaenaceae cyanobacterium LEGE 13415]
MEIGSFALYGGLTLKIKGHEEELTFPIDKETHEYLTKNRNTKWISIVTLDNWFLLVNAGKIVSLMTWNDLDQNPPGFEHPNVYKALSLSGGLEKQNLQEDLLKYCQEKDRKYEDENEESIWVLYNEVQIYTTDGQKHQVLLNEYNAYQLCDLEMESEELGNDLARFLLIEDGANGGVSWFNLSETSLIKVPAAARQILRDEDERRASGATAA